MVSEAREFKICVQFSGTVKRSIKPAKGRDIENKNHLSPSKKKTDNNFNKKRSKNKIAQWFEYKDAISNCTVEKISEKGTFLFRD